MNPEPTPTTSAPPAILNALFRHRYAAGERDRYGQVPSRSDNDNNITPGDTHSDIAPNLPSPPIGKNATSRDYLAPAHVARSRPHRRGAAVAGDGGDAAT
jgi:hypothetical protein